MKNAGFYYTDMHCHIMANIDDGPNNIEMSKDMLKIAYDEGIRTIVATPHYHPGKCMKDYDEIKKEFLSFQELAAQVCPEITLYLGRELYYTSDILDDLDNGKELSMNLTRYILIEYDPGVEYSYIKTSIYNISLQGFTPIIAHIERYGCILDDWERAFELKNMGAMIQVNAKSVMGDAGKLVKKIIKKMMKERLVDFVSTDAHSNRSRSPKIQECANYLSKKYGEQYARELLCENANAILQGNYLEE